MSQQVHWFPQIIMYISKAKTYFLQYQMNKVFDTFSIVFPNASTVTSWLKWKKLFLNEGPVLLP